jgi:hypothetical protein
MSLARRLAEHFVLPAHAVGRASYDDVVTSDKPAAAPGHSDARRTPAGVAVLAGAPDAPALGAAIGLALARLQRAPVVVVCVWSSADQVVRPPWRGPALPAARRLAGGLSARGHDARAAGRLAMVWLAESDDEAALETRRALAAAGDAPAVLALGGPRTAAFDALLSDQDLVVVGTRSGADPILTRLAVDALGGAVPACACEFPAARPARSLAVAGLALLPSARRALAAPVAELS